MSAIASQLASLVGADDTKAWDLLDSPRQHQIQSALADSPDCLVAPQTVEQLSEVMACAYKNRWRVLICGSGSKLHWGGLSEAVQVVISTANLNRVIDHAIGDLTVTAEAGVSIAALQQQLRQEQQQLAIAPTFAQQATLGGVVATADTGSIRQRYGGVRDMLIGISFLRYDGQPAKAGGRVVKNVAGYDLMKLFTGSWGTLGILTQLTFRLYPLPETSETVVLSGSPEAIAPVLQALRLSALTPTAVDLLAAPTMTELDLGNQMGLIVRFESIPISVTQQVEQLLKLATDGGLQGDRLSGSPEQTLWQRLQDQLDTPRFKQPIRCKMGVLPSQAVQTLAKLSDRINPLAVGIIHAGSGLGILRFEAESVSSSVLLELRQHCQTHGGFLSILESPDTWKRSLDLWGYPGNALTAMKAIKQQFDPNSLFSPGRFVGGI